MEIPSPVRIIEGNLRVGRKNETKEIGVKAEVEAGVEVETGILEFQVLIERKDGNLLDPVLDLNEGKLPYCYCLATKSFIVKQT